MRVASGRSRTAFIAAALAGPCACSAPDVALTAGATIDVDLAVDRVPLGPAEIEDASYEIYRAGVPVRCGRLRLSAGDTAARLMVQHLEPDAAYAIRVWAVSTSRRRSCLGTAAFAVEADARTVGARVLLHCAPGARHRGGGGSGQCEDGGAVPPPSAGVPLPASGGVAPSLGRAGRLADREVGGLDLGETIAVPGAFSQRGTSRWGDYSAMTIDPEDDHTFYFAGQFVADDGATLFGSGRWGTRILAFPLSAAAFPGGRREAGAVKQPLFDGIPFTGVFPPDTIGAAGPTYFVEAVNGAAGAVFAVFDKRSGAMVAAPQALTSLAPAGSPCAQGLGDPVVLWDEPAQRWVLSESSAVGTHRCVYVSRSRSPFGAGWHAYDFETPDFPDFAKLGVFQDQDGASAYLMTTNESLPALYALERDAMLAGRPARSQRFEVPALPGFDFQALTPAHLNGRRLSPGGAPGYFIRHRDDELHDAAPDPAHDFLELWRLSVDFARPERSVLRGPSRIAVADFDSDLCGAESARCIQQPGTETRLDSLREVVMSPLAYRRFPTHESLVGTFTVDVNGADQAGVRWFELRRGPHEREFRLFQDSTLAPDSASRWLPSIGIDGDGAIALGYSVARGDPPVADPLEPNDTPAAARPVGCGFASAHAKLDPRGDVDYYRVNGRAGDTLAIDIDAAQLGSNLDSLVGVLDTGLRLLAVNDDGRAAGEQLTVDSFLEATFPSDGVLLVAVTASGDFAFDGSGATSAGSYQMTLSCAAPPPPDPGEPNDDPMHATAAACPAVIEASISPHADRDFYRFESLPPGAVVDLDVDAATIGSALDATLAAFDGALDQLAASTAAPAPGEPLTADPFIRVAVPADGVVIVGVLAGNGTSRGAYQLACSFE